MWLRDIPGIEFRTDNAPFKVPDVEIYVILRSFFAYSVDFPPNSEVDYCLLTF